ncbi:BatA domain-containing protein [Nevskia sp.]|uniref:BatA domain-containing protein n=1 Tax=Nevskia sp. TaxID=1929292 RepID=UPI0025CD56D3|nr:BatA domain-containing protein [Nevskia sp.]
MIGFAAALGWLALVAVILPIAIHLIRRRAARDIAFAALEWLAARTPPRRQWRLDEPLLLALRLLLIALLAALLAQPFWHPDAEPDAAAVYVVPGIQADVARAAVDAPLADWRWLAEGYPALDQPPPAADPSALSSLIRELDRALPAATKLTLVVPDPLAGLDGERLRIGREVVWKALPAAALPEASAPAAPLFRIAIRAESTAADVARALVAAWQAAGVAIDVDEAPPGTPIAKDSALLIAATTTLDAATQASVVGGLNLLTSDPKTSKGEVLLRDVDGQPLLRRQASGRGQVYMLTGPLDPVIWPALRDPQLPLALLEYFRPAVSPPNRAPAASVAPVRSMADSEGPATPLAPWLVLLIALLWLIERGLATRQRSAAS